MASTGTRRGILDFPLAVALGDVSGVESFRKFGMNDVVGAGTYDIWPSATIRALPAAAGTVATVSTSAADAAAGTGARTVYLGGLDANYAEISETITLNGVTPVNSVQSYLRINRTYVLTAGTGEVNTGDINFTIGGNLQSTIEAGQGQCHCTQYTVPAGKNLLVMSTRFGTGRMGGTADLHILGQIKPFGANTSWRSIQDVYLFELIYQPPFVGGELIPAKTDMRYQVVSSAATQVWAEWSGWLLDA